MDLSSILPALLLRTAFASVCTVTVVAISSPLWLRFAARAADKYRGPRAHIFYARCPAEVVVGAIASWMSMPGAVFASLPLLPVPLPWNLVGILLASAAVVYPAAATAKAIGRRRL